MSDHRFGGPWTEDKLNRLRKYLRAYMTIFSRNERAAFLRPVYVDAFAGTGFRRQASRQPEDPDPLFDVITDGDADSFRKGSTYVALETDPPFAEYIFIEQNQEHAQVLQQLREDFPQLSQRVKIVSEDANSYLERWCIEGDWSRDRAVVFLDPYGMQVSWSTIAAMASTKAIDLWVLFPLGVAVNRLLLRAHPPEGAWADRLTTQFGTDAWRDVFYRVSRQRSLFGGSPEMVKDADFKRIAKFWIDRLGSVFEKVAPNPLPLRNSRNIPIYLLCFAAANPKGSATAVRIAQDILSR